MDEEERIKKFCRGYAMAQLMLDYAIGNPLMRLPALNMAREEMAKAYELFPATVQATIGHLYEHAAANRKRPKAGRRDRCPGRRYDSSVNSPHGIQKRRPSRLKVAVCAAAAIGAVLLVFLFVAPSYLPALGPKTGRIIDHDTGQGIAGADVVISGWYSQKGAWRDVSFCTYVAITKTDKDGYYHLPSEYSHVILSFPSADPKNSWYLYASKDGYVKADTKWPLQYDIDGGAHGVKRWDSRSYVTPRNGLEIRIPPIELMQVDMTLRQRIAYFRETGLAKYCSDDESYLKPMKQAVHRFYQSVADEICSSPENDTIESTTVSYLMMYADDSRRFVEALQKLDPQLNHHQMVSTSQPYRMGDVCKVVRAGGTHETGPGPRIVIRPANS